MDIAALKRDLDQSGIAAMKAAEQVHSIGQVARGVRAGRFEQRIQM